MTPVEAWTAVVAGEDAAVYAYSVAGGRVRGSAQQRALAGLEVHRSNRSRAASLVTASGGTPPPAAPAYELPEEVGVPREAKALMAEVDNALVAVYADAAAASTGEDRRWAARVAADSAVRAVGWGAPTQAFPTAEPSAQ